MAPLALGRIYFISYIVFFPLPSRLYPRPFYPLFAKGRSKRKKDKRMPWVRRSEIKARRLMPMIFPPAVAFKGEREILLA